MPINDDLAEEAVRHAIGLQRLGNREIRKVIALLNDVQERIVARLLRSGDSMSALSRARQQALLDDIKYIVESVYSDATGKLHISLEALARYEVEYQSGVFKNIIPVDLPTVTPSSAQILAAVRSRPFQGRLLREWYADLPKDAFKRLRNSIRMGIVEGRTVDQMVRDIRGTRALGYKDGILEINRRNAATTVRTAVAHTSSAARSVFYEENSDLIAGEQWIAVLDGRTSPICRGRDNKIFPVGVGPRPPAHPNCRSGMTPVLKSAKALGLTGLPGSTRASMNGQVAADMSYSDWLRKQPVEFQNDVLGYKKAIMFRNGGLDLDRFTNKAGREYTLDELRRRESDAWTKAGLNS